MSEHVPTSEEYMVNVADSLIDITGHKNVTYIAIGRAANLNRRTLERIAQKEVSNVRFPTLVSSSSVLGGSLVDMIEYDRSKDFERLVLNNQVNLK